MKFTVVFYETPLGKFPFDEWLEDQDYQDVDRILIRIGRLKLGNLSNCEPVGGNVSEIKLDFGPGYRVYFTNISPNEILILCAGTKKKQSKDIEKAKDYLKEYKMRGKKT